MQSSRISRKLLRSEEGRSLPLALVVVAVGALLVSPFLAYVSTSLLGSRAMQEGMNKQYSSDAGVEFGIWKLVNDSGFRSQVDSTPGTPVVITPTITVNQFTTAITVTALSAGGWITLINAPANVGAGGALAYTGGDYIYALRGNNQRNLWQYSISGNSWTNRRNAPRVGGGGALAYTGGDYIYALRGNGTTAFRRYRISNNSWAERRRTPAAVGYGGALAYTGGDYIYAFRGGNTDDFWQYRISNNRWNWNVDPADPGVTIGPGGALAYDGGDYIYAFRGNYSNLFGRYHISGDSWEVRALAPGSVGGGAALVYTGDDYIYAFQGNGSAAFWRYSISQDSWDDTLPPAPDTIGDGGALTYDGTYIYAFQGNNSQSFWRFSPGPSTYDIMTTADGVTISAQIVISETDVTIQAWDIE